MEKIQLLDHFTLVEYNGVPYPEGYTADIHEVAGHLDKDSIEVTGHCSFVGYLPSSLLAVASTDSRNACSTRDNSPL